MDLRENLLMYMMDLHRASHAMLLKEAGLLGATQPVRMLCSFSSSPLPHHRIAQQFRQYNRTNVAIHNEYISSAKLTGMGLNSS